MRCRGWEQGHKARSTITSRDKILPLLLPGVPACQGCRVEVNRGIRRAPKCDNSVAKASISKTKNALRVIYCMSRGAGHRHTLVGYGCRNEVEAGCLAPIGDIAPSRVGESKSQRLARLDSGWGCVE